MKYHHQKRLGIILLVLLAIAAVAVLTTSVVGELKAEASASLAVFFIVVVLEVIIAPIPGGVIAYLGAANFGFFAAWPVSYFGNLIGGTVVFYLARHIGKPFVDKVMSKKDQRKYEGELEQKKWRVWLMFAIPVFPVDMLCIAGGLSPIKRKVFFPIYYSAMLVHTGTVALVGSQFRGVIPGLEYIALGVFVLFLLLAGFWLFYQYHQHK